MIAGLLALMITGSALAVQPKQTVSPGQTLTANTGGASHTVIWGQIRPSTTYGGWEIVPLSATLDGSGNMALIVKMAAGSAGSPASFSQVVSGSAFIGANGATGPFVTIANTISQGDITGAGKAVNFSVTNGGTYVNAPGNVLVLGNGGQFPVVGGTYFYGAVGSAGPAVTMQGHAPGSATQWAIKVPGASTVAADPIVAIGGSNVAGGTIKYATVAPMGASAQNFNMGTNQGFLTTSGLAFYNVTGATTSANNWMSGSATPFIDNLYSTPATPLAAPFSIPLGRYNSAATYYAGAVFTMTPTGTNGDMALILTGNWQTADAALGATTNALAVRMVQPTDGVGAVYRAGLNAATATATILVVGGTRGDTTGNATPVGMINLGALSAPSTVINTNSAFQTVAAPFLRTNGPQASPNYASQTGATQWQSASMPTNQMTATGSGGVAADVRSVGAAGLGTVTAYDVGSTQALGVTRTVDSTIAGGNEMWIGLDPSAAEAGVVYISFTSCNDAKLNGFPITHIGATLAAGANANFIGPYHRGNLNLKVGDKWYLYAASTLAVREHITQTR